jgi:hypothetical protein
MQVYRWVTFMFSSLNVCYLNLKTYIALSSMSQWASYDKVFNLEEFYDSIVMTFETDPEDPWVIDTLKWWNE